ncbi:MAG: TIGR00266 family protein [Thermoprotei archaeon]|nr:TIGR00266 family protein [TACK group archaeon]
MPSFSIEGNDLQYVRCQLATDEKVYGDAGHLLMKSSTVQMNTVMRGGLISAFKREITGGSFFVTEMRGPGEVDFAGAFPGKIVEVDLGQPLLAESHSFLVAEDTVQYDAKMTRLSAGFFGGEGLFLARFTGTGKLFLHAYGALEVLDLKPGDEVQIEASHLLALQDGMDYGVSRVGGIKSMLFSGEGWFFVNVRGPGRVYLHSLTAVQLAQSLIPYLPAGGQRGGLAIGGINI